ncbi:MAG: tRNA(Met) cytidine acetyltransferase [Natrialbaceae archaeon]|jgi:tRNA(Met) cytidine acetyltransferase
MDLVALATDLHAEARRTDERRLLVLSGPRTGCYEYAARILDELAVPIAETTVVGEHEFLECERVAPRNVDELLGTTREVIVVDAHDELRPNGLGTVVGAVDGGGLLVLCTPPLDEWPTRRDGFDEGLAVPPFSVEAVTAHFRRRLVDLLDRHRGIAVVDLDAGEIRNDGLTRPVPRLEEAWFRRQKPSAFPGAAYDACLTEDQADAVDALEVLREDGQAVVIEADRGRGKSSAAGLAAGSLAAEGADVLVTAPAFRSAAEVFERARELLETIDDIQTDEENRLIGTEGCLEFRDPFDAVEAVDEYDLLIVDEAAALGVDLLESTLAADRVAYATTVHGYEGAGRGFSVRFRDRLEESDQEITDVTMSAPIRYAAGDPVEAWGFHTLMLDARPPVDALVAGARPSSTTYRRIDAEELASDEHLLREVFGLLVLAHYRTEPNDLARLLDAPNVRVRALTHEGHVVSVALLAREGGLPPDVRSDMYKGGRVRGNMLPDVLTSQLRDEDAGAPVGLRVLRIATHHAVRSSGLGSRLLGEVREEFADEVDWLGTGYGATPELLRFWERNGYRSVHLATTRNETSGEYSVLMLNPTSEAGRDLAERHERWFVDRIASVLSDPLDDADPDVVRAVLQATDVTREPDLTDYEWRLVADAAFGPGLFDMAPGPFREVALAGLLDPCDDHTVREERLLVKKVLQGGAWPDVANELDFHSPRLCMLALGTAFVPLVERFAPKVARKARERFDQ